MKKLIFLALFACAFIGCEKDHEHENVKACFSYVPTEVTAGEIQFTNCSEHASRYLWDFGDGKTSNEKDPLHVFTGPYPVIVTLVAYNGTCANAVSRQLYDEIIVFKPNIYLYPLSPLNICVSIKFPLGGSILESIPEYADGWCVDVDTTGKIDNQYDYLFYESRQPDVFQNDRGWCVAQTSLKSFFERNMSLYNFSGREIKDFVDYWVPKLNEHAYYMIYPQTNRIIDRAIQLNFSKQPDEINRMFYGIAGIDKYTTIEEPLIDRFQREGFYVMEWGVFRK
jgi:hypothetical protein